MIIFSFSSPYPVVEWLKVGGRVANVIILAGLDTVTIDSLLNVLEYLIRNP